MRTLRSFATALAFFSACAAVLEPKIAFAQMSESDRKASARTAYQEGIALQEKGSAREALARFEAAQKLFDAPTHLLHIAQCQALTGKLVEAAETYETLVRKNLGDGAPDVFRQAVQQGQIELAQVRERIPTLRVTVRPEASRLSRLRVTINGSPMPNELLGLARPIDPGTYRVEATADGLGTPTPITTVLAEKDQKNVEAVLVGRIGTSAPSPEGPTRAEEAPTPPPYAPTAASPKPTSSPFGLLFGAHGAVVVPAGSLEGGVSVNDHVGVGGGGGVDVYGRLVKMLLIGATFEYASLASKAITLNAGEASAHTLYTGLSIGILPNVDKVSFLGDVGLGYREMGGSVTSDATTTKYTYSGLDYGVSGGISIPAGPIRIVPRMTLHFGTFSSTEGSLSSGSLTSRSENEIVTDALHVVFTAGLALFYHLDLGKKPAAP